MIYYNPPEYGLRGFSALYAAFPRAMTAFVIVMIALVILAILVPFIDKKNSWSKLAMLVFCGALCGIVYPLTSIRLFHLEMDQEKRRIELEFSYQSFEYLRSYEFIDDSEFPNPVSELVSKKVAKQVLNRKSSELVAALDR